MRMLVFVPVPPHGGMTMLDVPLIVPPAMMLRPAMAPALPVKDTPSFEMICPPSAFRLAGQHTAAEEAMPNLRIAVSGGILRDRQ